MAFAFSKGKSTIEAQPDLSAGLARALKRARVAAGDEPVADPVAEAALLLDAAMVAIDRAAKIVREAAQRVIAAANETDAGARSLLAEQYDDVRRRVDALSEAGGEVGALTMLGAVPLSVPLGGATYMVAPFPLSTEEDSLALPPPQEGFETHAEVAEVLRRVETALERIGRARAIYEQDRDFLRGKSARRAA